MLVLPYCTKDDRSVKQPSLSYLIGDGRTQHFPASSDTVKALKIYFTHKLRTRSGSTSFCKNNKYKLNYKKASQAISRVISDNDFSSSTLADFATTLGFIFYNPDPHPTSFYRNITAASRVVAIAL